MYKESFSIASDQLKEVLAAMKSLGKEIEALERTLEIEGAPYTPGRWPDWE
jgi:hypothetical protein